LAFAYVGSANAAVSGATEIHCNRPAGIATGNLIVAVYAFEGVGAVSGPWITPNTGSLSSNYIGPATGWEQLAMESPSGSGVGVEVWGAVHTSGTIQWAAFNASYSAVTVTAGYSGEYAPNNSILDGCVRGATVAQVTGNAPPAPSVFSVTNDLVIAIGADEMTAATFGSPTGYTSRVDVARSGAGTAEAVIADAVSSVTGDTGLITFPNNAASGGTLGTTATLSIRPTGSTTPNAFYLTAPLPEDLLLASGYSLQVAAVSPATGQPVSGVNIDTTVLTATTLLPPDAQNLEVGQWFLVPGPGA